MKNWIAIVSIAGVLACFGTPVRAQDLGPHVKTIRDGIYVYAVDEENSNVTIIRTEQGIVLVDTKRLKDAEDAYHDAIALQRQLVADFRNVPDYQNQLAASLDGR